MTDTVTHPSLPPGVVATALPELRGRTFTCLSLSDEATGDTVGRCVLMGDDLLPLDPQTFAAIIAAEGLPREEGPLAPETFAHLVVHFYPPEAPGYPLFGDAVVDLIDEAMASFLGPRLDGPVVEDYGDAVIVTFLVAIPAYRQIEEWTASVEGDMSLVISRLAL